MDEIVVGIDVGTTKVCTLVGRVEEEAIRILGSGVEPSEGIKKGVIVDLAAAGQAITRSVEKAEQVSGVEITGGPGQPGRRACLFHQQPRRGRCPGRGDR